MTRTQFQLALFSMLTSQTVMKKYGYISTCERLLYIYIYMDWQLLFVCERFTVCISCVEGMMHFVCDCFFVYHDCLLKIFVYHDCFFVYSGSSVMHAQVVLLQKEVITYLLPMWGREALFLQYSAMDRWLTLVLLIFNQLALYLYTAAYCVFRQH